MLLISIMAMAAATGLVTLIGIKLIDLHFARRALKHEREAFAELRRLMTEGRQVTERMERKRQEFARSRPQKEFKQ